MKKCFLAVFVAIMLFFLTVPVFAENLSSDTTDKISTSVDFRNETILKEHDSYIKNSLNIWVQSTTFGTFIEPEIQSTDADSYERLKMSLLWKIKQSPFYLLGGTSVDNKGSDFVQFGIWYIDNLGPFRVLLDLRDYVGISNQNNGYTDNTLRAMYPLFEKVSIGADIIYDHWWEEGNDLLLIGPRISLEISDSVSVYIRVSHEWNTLDTGTEQINRIRIGLCYKF